MLLQVGVKALLKNKEGKYLLVRRNPKKYPDVPASWDMPGGRIEPGTGLLENLKREILEETQLALAIEPQLVAAQDIFPPDKHVVRLTFVGEIEGIAVVDEENTEARWFAAEEILTMTDLDKFLQKLLDSKTIRL